MNLGDSNGKLVPVIPALRSLRQEFEAGLNYTVRCSLN